MKELIKFIIYSAIGAIIFLMIYSYFFAPEMNSNMVEKVKDKIIDIKDTITESVQTNPSNSSISSLLKGCPNYITPDRISILEYNGGGWKKFSSAWEDGTEIGIYEWKEIPDFASDVINHNCHMGIMEGENTNYLYCDNLYYRNIVKDIDEKGNINNVEDRKYIINLILKSEGKWEIKEDMTSIPCKDKYCNELIDGYLLSPDGKTVIKVDGEAWVEIDEIWKRVSIYRNYSIVSIECKKE